MASTSLTLACRCLLRRGRADRLPSFRGFSTAPKTNDKEEDVAIDRMSSQPFVVTRLEPGEWDPANTDPLYRPKFKSTAKIISADDFAARPSVGFTGEFESFQDAMVTLSWLEQSEHKHIYQLYLDMMLSTESKFGKTSHEYVMRVIAQKYNITAERVAAVVQLQHNEEQILQNEPDRKLLTETAERMDTRIKQEINDAYQTFKLKKPESYTEDPVGVNELQDRKKWLVAEDLFDVDQMTENATVRDERKARMIIDGHVYVEDVDDESIPVPMDKDCRHLLNQKEKIAAALAEKEQTVIAQRAKKAAVEPVWRTQNGEGETRDRWKYIAQTVNTRQLKKAHKKHRSYINNSAENTLVEYAGELRPANMADLKSVAWKLTRHPQEHTYAGAKKGWLDRINRNAVKTWGKSPVRLDKPVTAPAVVDKTAVVETPNAATGQEASAGTNTGESDKPVVVPDVADEMAVVESLDAATGQESSAATHADDIGKPVVASDVADETAVVDSLDAAAGQDVSPATRTDEPSNTETVDLADASGSSSSSDDESDSSPSEEDAGSSSEDDSDGPDKPTDRK